MIPARVRRFLEDVMPWWDRAEEDRRDEVSIYIHDHAVDNRVEREETIKAEKVAVADGLGRIRAAYLASDRRQKQKQH